MPRYILFGLYRQNVNAASRIVSNESLTEQEKLRLNNISWRFYFTLNRYKPTNTVIHHLDGLSVANGVFGDPNPPVMKEEFKLTSPYDENRRYGLNIKPYNYRLGYELIADEWAEFIADEPEE